MTQDDIIFMARASGWMSEYESSTGFSAEAAFKFAALVASAEREACAEICKKHADFYAGLEPSPIAQSAWAACVDSRDTIRARNAA